MSLRIAVCLALSLHLATPSTTLAVEDGDILGQCLEDNADEGQTTESLAAYCACANEKMMQDNYGRNIDISEWEKLNADGQETCSKQAGWISQQD